MTTKFDETELEYFRFEWEHYGNLRSSNCNKQRLDPPNVEKRTSDPLDTFWVQEKKRFSTKENFLDFPVGYTLKLTVLN